MRAGMRADDAARVSGLRWRGAESYQKGARVSGVRVCRGALGAAGVLVPVMALLFIGRGRS